MADVFISYAHEDQPFVRRIAPALEAEGFSVWWDHTIPPGQSWDTFIARGIEEAKACIVVWSAHSVGSDWVKEEATLAKDGGKYLPVSFGADQPPVGFRRIQSANLTNWSGNREDPQWRMLASAAGALVRGERFASAPPPRIADKQARPAGANRTALIAGGAVTLALLAGGGFLLMGRQPAPAPVVVAEQAAPEPVNAAPDNSMVEIEKLRRENEEARQRAQAEIEQLRLAVQNAENAREAEKRQADLRAAEAAQAARLADQKAAEQRAAEQRAAAASAYTLQSLSGTWQSSWVWTKTGNTGENDRTLASNGTFTTTGNNSGTWRVNGRQVFMQVTGGNRTIWDGQIQSDKLITGKVSNDKDQIGTFEMRR